jgi:hypothetical protein
MISNNGSRYNYYSEIDDVSDNNTIKHGSDKSQKSYKLGDTIEFDGFIISALTVDDPYIESSEFFQPEEGMRYIAVEVSYENRSTKTLNYSWYDWTLYDEAGYNYDASIFATKEPALNTSSLNSGNKTRGWITYEVQDSAKNFTIQFKPDFFSSGNIEIELF